jgi:hypothetical protein
MIPVLLIPQGQPHPLPPYPTVPVAMNMQPVQAGGFSGVNMYHPSQAVYQNQTNTNYNSNYLSNMNPSASNQNPGYSPDTLSPTNAGNQRSNSNRRPNN